MQRPLNLNLRYLPLFFFLYGINYFVNALFHAREWITYLSLCFVHVEISNCSLVSLFGVYSNEEY